MPKKNERSANWLEAATSLRLDKQSAGDRPQLGWTSHHADRFGAEAPLTNGPRAHPSLQRGGLDGLGDRPGAGRKRRITETERSLIIWLVGTDPPGRLLRGAGGELAQPPSLGREPRSAVCPKRTRVVNLYVEEPKNATTICLDELGPVSPRTY